MRVVSSVIHTKWQIIVMLILMYFMLYLKAGIKLNSTLKSNNCNYYTTVYYFKHVYISFGFKTLANIHPLSATMQCQTYIRRVSTKKEAERKQGIDKTI